MFASLPKEVRQRIYALEAILKEMQKDILHLKYQFRTGVNDVKLMVKEQSNPSENFFWKEVNLAEFDPNNTLPKFESSLFLSENDEIDEQVHNEFNQEGM